MSLRTLEQTCTQSTVHTRIYTPSILFMHLYHGDQDTMKGTASGLILGPARWCDGGLFKWPWKMVDKLFWKQTTSNSPKDELQAAYHRLTIVLVESDETLLVEGDAEAPINLLKYGSLELQNIVVSVVYEESLKLYVKSPDSSLEDQLHQRHQQGRRPVHWCTC